MRKRNLHHTLLLGALVTASTACSVLLNSSPQCVADSDCANRGSEFAGYICGGDNTCVAPVKIVAAGDAGGAGCENTAKCTADNGGLASVCRQPGTPCVAIATPACPTVIGEYADPNAIFVGALLHLTGPRAGRVSYNVDYKNEISMALTELQTTIQGIPGGVNGARRPIVGVACDVGVANTNPTATYSHLVDEVGITAALVADQTMGIPFFTDFASKKNIFTYFLETGPDYRQLLTGVGDTSIIFQPAPPFPYYGKYMAEKVGTLETRLRTVRGLAPSDQIKVAVFSNGQPEYGAAADELVKNLSFNGKTATANGANYTRFEYDIADPNVNLASVAADITAFAPDIIISWGGSETQRTILPLVEGSWTASKPRPTVLFNPFAIGIGAFNLIGTNAERAQRTFAVAGLADSADLADTATTFQSFFDRYKALYPSAPNFSLGGGYDAVYATAYAMVAAGQVPTLTGQDIARGLVKISGPGPKLSVGPVDLGAGLASLANGTIQLQGAVQNLRWDSGRGWAPTDAGFLCFATAPGSQPRAQVQETLVWKTQAIQPGISCF